MNHEKGFILPLMFSISLIFASLLLTMAGRLESRAISYERRQLYQKMSLMEMEALKRISQWPKEVGDAILYLEAGIPLNLNVTLFEIHYQFTYNGYIRSGTLEWRNGDEETDSPDWDDGEREDDDWENPLPSLEPSLDGYGSTD